MSIYRNGVFIVGKGKLFEVSFTEESWTEDEEISLELKEELRKVIMDRIDRILVAHDLMEPYGFIFSMVIHSGLKKERSDGETDFYNFEINREEPQAITILCINPEGTHNIGTLFISVSKILIPKLVST